MLMFYKEKEN